MNIDELVKAISEMIEGWGDDQLHAGYANDGEGHFDFVGFKMRDAGRAELREVLRKFYVGERV
jgi:hypothetical protein